MKPLHVLLLVLYFLGFAIQPLDSAPDTFGKPPEIDPVMDAGFGVARVGANGWYTSDWTVYAVSPVLANGRLLQPGKSLTVSDEGEHIIKYASPDGQSTAEQIIRIDKTPPQVTWITPLNFEVTAKSSGLSADISDSGSGICLVELSSDNGRSWIEGWNAAGFALSEPIHETTWAYHDGFPNLDEGGHVMIARARDCAGNLSPGEILVVQVKHE